MRKQHRMVFSPCWLWLVLAACQPAPRASEKPADQWAHGTIHISCDESFKPVMDQQVAVYEGLYPAARIIVHYKPEAECLRDFGVDSIRIVIATRGFSEAERRFMADSMNVAPEQAR